MASLLPFIKPRFDDKNGLPLQGGKVWSYLAGTSTPTATYSDPQGLVPNENPVILDASGEANIWLRPGSYKFVVMDSDDVIQYTVDHVRPADGGGGGIVDSDYTFDIWSLRFDEPFVSTGLMDTLEKILQPGYQAQTISLSGSSNSVREKGTPVSSVDLTATIQKKTYAISNVKFYQGITLLDEQTSGGAIPNGGTSSYTYSTPFSDMISFSARATDTAGPLGGPTEVTSNTVTYTFVYPYYYGVGAAGLGAGVAALTKDIITSNANLTRSFSPNGSQKMYFAYPASYGALTAIFDVNNFNTIADWTMTTQNITGLDGNPVSYRIYEFNNYAVAGTYSYRFVR